jgi:hypothetical protein
MPSVSTLLWDTKWGITLALLLGNYLGPDGHKVGIYHGPRQEEATGPFRNLRNVADHIAQRADFVVSRGGAALGTLSWLTGFKIDPITVWYCTLRPGTVRMQPKLRKKPLVSTLDWPTDRIILAAGGYEGNLSSVRPHIRLRVEHFEEQLRNAFHKLNLLDSPTASDVLTRQPYSPAPGQFADGQRGSSD